MCSNVLDISRYVNPTEKEKLFIENDCEVIKVYCAQDPDLLVRLDKGGSMLSQLGVSVVDCECFLHVFLFFLVVHHGSVFFVVFSKSSPTMIHS